MRPPAAKQGQALVRQPDLQSQPRKRMLQVGPHAQNFSQKFLLARQGQSPAHGPTHSQGLYPGQGLPMSCLWRLLTTCVTQRM